MDEDRKEFDIDNEEIIDEDENKRVEEIVKNLAEAQYSEKIDDAFTDNVIEREADLGDSIQEDVVEEKQIASKNREKKQQGNKYKYLIYLSVILLITACVLWYNLIQPTTGLDGTPMLVYETIPDVVAQTNVWYFLLLILSVVFGFFIAALIIWTFAKLYTKHYKMHKAVANALIGAFYSAITPGSSGGQFAQVYVFKKQGMPVSNAASIFVMSFIVYQCCLIIFGIISLITSFQSILNINVIPISIGDLSFDLPIWIFIAFGFFLNLIVIIALFFMSLSRRFQNFVCNGLIGICAKLKIIRNPEEKRKSIRIQVENYRIEFRRLQSNLAFTGLIFLIYCVSIINSNIQPFLCGLALNAFDAETLSSVGAIFEKIYQSIVYSNFHQMATGLLPLPGSAGVSEIVFGSLFGQTSGYFSSRFYETGGGINILLLLWRFMTFYIPFIINGVVAATYKSRGMPVKDRILPVGDKKTMLTIQLSTYAERKETSDIAYETRVMERKELLQRMIKFSSKSEKDKESKSKKERSEKKVKNKKDEEK